MGGYKRVIFLRLSVVIYGYKRLKWRKVHFYLSPFMSDA